MVGEGIKIKSAIGYQKKLEEFFPRVGFGRWWVDQRLCFDSDQDLRSKGATIQALRNGFRSGWRHELSRFELPFYEIHSWTCTLGSLNSKSAFFFNSAVIASTNLSDLFSDLRWY